MICLRCTSPLNHQARCYQCGLSIPLFALDEPVAGGEGLEPCETHVEPVEVLAECVEDFRAGLLDLEAVAEELYRFQASFQELSQDFQSGLEEGLYLERLASPSTTHQQLLKEHFRVGTETVAAGLEDLWHYLEGDGAGHCDEGLSALRRGGDHLAQVGRLLDQSAQRLESLTN